MASVSSTSSTTNSTSSNLVAKTGIGGLVSGMDIDELVEQLTESSRAKILKQNQKVQKLEWKQTAYREVNTALTEFQSSYLDLLSKNNLGSTSTFNTIAATSSTESVSVASNSSSYAGKFTVNSITQLATSEYYTGNAASAELAGTISDAALTSGEISSLTSQLYGKSIGINLDGTYRTITFNEAFMNSVAESHLGGPWSEADFQRGFQLAVDTAFGVTDTENGTDRVLNVSLSEGKLSFTAVGSQVTFSAVSEDTATLTALGLTGGQTNKISVGTQLDKIGFATALSTDSVETETDEDGNTSSIGTYKFTINDVDFEFKSTQSLKSIIDTVNNSSADVTLSYSTITDRFTLTSNTTGAGNNITMSQETGNLLDAMGINIASETNAPTRTAGQNAVLTIDGQQISRSSNDISVNGVVLTLNEATDVASTITMKEDASGLSDVIHEFVEDYNNVIKLIKDYSSAKADSKYAPLSDAQKDEMSESEIEKWETKAKAGILNNDSILNNISSKLQNAMYSMYGGYSLFSMGISTSDYTANGQLTIDEDKLKSALATDGARIREMFTADGGLADVLDQVIESAVKTSGPQGSRGMLVEAAGVASTSSDTQNTIYTEIERINDYINSLTDRLETEETRLWKQFTTMEKALSNLNTQSSLIMQFGSDQ